MNKIESEIAEYIFNPRSIWETLSKSIHDEFKAHSKTIQVQKNETIYKEDTYSKGLYILNKGAAKLYVVDNSGREQIIYMLAKGDMFGHSSILTRNNSMFYISTIEDCEIEIINRDSLVSSMQHSFELNEFFLEFYGHEQRTLLRKISVFSLKPVNERIALTLLVLNQKFNSGGENIISISKKDIANYAGTIIETLSRQLKALSKMNAIKMKGRKIILTDLDLLFDVANINP